MYQVIDSTPFINYITNGYETYYQMVMKSKKSKILLDDNKYLWIVRSDSTYDSLVCK